MDVGLTITPVFGAAAGDSVRPTAAPPQGAAANDLPDAPAATPATAPGTIPNSVPQTAAASTGSRTQSITIDPQTRDVIYRVVDTRTQQVIQQIPDQALLRNQAYSSAIQNGATPFEAQVQADFET